jgi:hypothetical protein
MKLPLCTRSGEGSDHLNICELYFISCINYSVYIYVFVCICVSMYIFFAGSPRIYFNTLKYHDRGLKYIVGQICYYWF